MKKKELLGILGDFKAGDLTLNEANELILALFSVSNTVTCENCDEPTSEWYCKRCYEEAADSLPY